MMDFVQFSYQIIALFVLLALTALSMLFLYMYLTTVTKPNLHRHETEKTFTDPKSKKKLLFPSIFDEPTVDLSLIVPAYKETERMPAMLNEAIEYLEAKQSKQKGYKYEIIVVDDGSADGTSETAMLYSEKYGSDKVRVLTLVANRGKGGAIKMGALSARGEWILFADADGATTFEDYGKLESAMKSNVSKAEDVVVCGSRAHLEDESIAQRSLFRTFLMKGFHFIVWFLCVRGVKDTQCGFKLLTRSAGRQLFTNLHIDRWAFDVEMLYIAQRLNMRLDEVAVRWQEIDGSKLAPFWSGLQMGRDLLFIRLRYMFGLWRIEPISKLD